MKRNSVSWMFFLALLGSAGSAYARDTVIPAGTLMQCTLDEPNFSSATANVGDPFLCHPRTLQQFGQSVFPRGTYLVGHLEAFKDPGHFWGKGWLKLEFDRIGLPATDLPLPAKVIAVKDYRVNREGNIIGHGHATRDTVEWLIPPLWPWKLVSLPARGPRPALKGEITVTLRVMDDIGVPENAALPWRHFGQPDADLYGRQPFAPTSAPMYRSGPGFQPAQAAVSTMAPQAHFSLTATAQRDVPEDAVPAPLSSSTGFTSQAPAPPTRQSPQITLFALKNGTVYAVADYWKDGDRMAYLLANGAGGTVDMNDLDWNTTTTLNSERNVRVSLRNGPSNF